MGVVGAATVRSFLVPIKLERIVPEWFDIMLFHDGCLQLRSPAMMTLCGVSSRSSRSSVTKGMLGRLYIATSRSSPSGVLMWIVVFSTEIVFT